MSYLEKTVANGGRPLSIRVRAKGRAWAQCLRAVTTPSQIGEKFGIMRRYLMTRRARAGGDAEEEMAYWAQRASGGSGCNSRSVCMIAGLKQVPERIFKGESLARIPDAHVRRERHRFF